MERVKKRKQKQNKIKMKTELRVHLEQQNLEVYDKIKKLSKQDGSQTIKAACDDLGLKYLDVMHHLKKPIVDIGFAQSICKAINAKAKIFTETAGLKAGILIKIGTKTID